MKMLKIKEIEYLKSTLPLLRREALGLRKYSIAGSPIEYLQKKYDLTGTKQEIYSQITTMIKEMEDAQENFEQETRAKVQEDAETERAEMRTAKAASSFERTDGVDEDGSIPTPSGLAGTSGSDIVRATRKFF